MPEYASWGRRFLAWLVDLVIVATPLVAVLWPLAEAYGGETTEDAFVFLFLAGPASALVLLGYYGLLQGGKRGQTLGKRAAGIAVRRAEDFGRLGYGRSLSRAFGLLLIWFFLGSLSLFVLPLLDGLWALVDKRNQTVHDKLASTVVVRLSEKALLGRPSETVLLDRQAGDVEAADVPPKKLSQIRSSGGPK